MKKPSSKIREEIAKLQEQLKQSETRQSERIGRVALKAGLGEIEVEDLDLQSAFEEIAARFRKGSGAKARVSPAPAASGAASSQTSEG